MLGPFVVLFGATGSGKTELLRRLCAGEAEVVSADSMQVYRDLRIGTAKPPPSVRAVLPHHLIDICSLQEYFDLGTFVRLAERSIVEIASRRRLPIVSGGTAFYLHGLLYGLPAAPQVDPAVRRALFEEVRRAGIEPLRRELERVDPATAARLPPGDTYRTVRALEVYRTAGRPLSQYPVPKRRRADLDVEAIGLWSERDELYRRIDRRVDEMYRAGLTVEIAALRAAGCTGKEPGLRGIGYREFFSALSAGRLTPNELELEPGTEPPAAVAEVLTEIKRNTRRYAKRQLTFFRRLQPVRWFRADEQETLAAVFREAGRRLDRAIDIRARGGS